jgi:plastocyanin
VSRTILMMLASVLATMSLVFAGAATAAPVKVVGTVGPGETITLKLGGKKVTKLKAGVAYRFVVTDRSQDHDFRLVGPGVNRVITGERFMGTKSVVLKFKKSTYRFFCAPHADDMRGGFKVVG